MTLTRVFFFSSEFIEYCNYPVAMLMELKNFHLRKFGSVINYKCDGRFT